MKKILVPVDEGGHSKKAVQYAATICAAAEDLTFTVFHVQPLIPRILSNAAERSPSLGPKIEDLVQRNAQGAAHLSSEIRRLITSEEIPEKRIQVVVEPMGRGMAKDILEKAEQGGYDAIVLGRRALTPARDFFIGTTAAKIVEHAQKTPVWIVGEKSPSMEFMLAVDGSENAAREVDHVIGMVGLNPKLRLTLYHVVPYLRHYYSMDFERKSPRLQEILHSADKKRMEGFYAETYGKLKAGGFKKSQIKIKTEYHAQDISTAILKEARTGDYTTVVVGRRGEGDAYFTGRIAMRLVQRVRDQTLWVLP
jgi:nucleotide-binding universal stress UspA family protein